MRTPRTWKTHAARALAIGAMLLSPAFVVAQEQDRQSEAGPSHRGQVAAIENGTLVMTIDGAQRHTHEVSENAKVTINGESASLQDLRPGDRIEVRTEEGNPNVALLIAATRQEGAEEQQQQRDRGEARRTFRQGDEQQQGRDREQRQGRGQADQQRAWLGVLLAPDQEGVRVVQVVPGSPADRAGIRVGDLLVGAQGQEFAAPEDVSQAIAEEQPGSTVNLTIERQGRERELDVRLATRPQMEQPGRGFPGGQDMDRMLREFRGFGPDRQLMQEHRQIQQEHEQLKEQVNELQQQLRQLRRELNQLQQQRQGEGGENEQQNS